MSALPATYSFHKLFSIRVSHRGLDALLKSELGVFQEEREDAVDLRIEEGKVAPLDRTLSYPWDDVSYSFDNSSMVMETPSGRIQFLKRLLRAEPGVSAKRLLRGVTNLLRQRIMERGASLVHASAVSRNRSGYLFPAWAHSGKTNVALNFLMSGYDYMSDDWCFVTKSGHLLGYPRHLSIFDYNIHCHPTLRETLRQHEGVGNLNGRLAVTEFAYTLRTSHHLSRRVREWLLARFGVHEEVPVSVAVPGCRIALRSPLSKACLLVMTNADAYEICEVSPENLAGKVVSCGYFERGAFRRHQAAAAFSGMSELEDLIRAETELLTQAFASAKCVEVRLPRGYDRTVLNLIRRRLEEL